MQSHLYRKSTVERVSSPEQLQDYMRVTNPGIWMVLAAVIALLAGLLVASALVRVETTVTARGEIAGAGSEIVMAMTPEAGADIRDGMPVRLAGHAGKVNYVRENDGELIVTASLEASDEVLPAGVYDVEIVTEVLSPISFLLN